MIEGLLAAVEEVDIPVDGDAIAAVLRARDALDAKLADTLGRFDALGLWDLDSATSLTGWLRDRGQLTAGAASSLARTAKRLVHLPVTAAAWAAGVLCGGQVQAVVANLNDRVAPLFAQQEPDLVPVLAGLTVGETAVAMQAWRAGADDLVDRPEPSEPERCLHLSETLDGRRELTGTFDPFGGEILDVALRLAETGDGADGDERRSPARRRGDALVDMAQFFLDHQHHVPAGRNRPHVSLVRTIDNPNTPGFIVGGGPVDNPTFEAAACDATTNWLGLDRAGAVVNLTAATRVVPTALYNALVIRDGHCRHPGCDRPPTWCHAHHVIPVHQGGPTTLANLVLKCSRHHHRAHQPGWTETLHPDGTLTITNPNGQTRTTRPPGHLALTA